MGVCWSWFTYRKELEYEPLPGVSIRHGSSSEETDNNVDMANSSCKVSFNADQQTASECDYEPLSGSNTRNYDSSKESNMEDATGDSPKISPNGKLQLESDVSFNFIADAQDNSNRQSVEGNVVEESKEVQQYHSEGNPIGQAAYATMKQNEGLTAQSVEIQGSANFTFITNNETGKYSSRITEIFSSMKRMLQLRYRQDLMPRLPWMPEYIRQLKKPTPTGSTDETQRWVLRLSNLYVKIAMCPRGTFGEYFGEQDIELQNVFDEIHPPETRILVEGPPAYGKSTLALKVCQDWAVGREEYTKRFQLVFLIHLRNFKHNTFWEVLNEAARINMPDVADKEIQEVIENNASTILLVLDGFDELHSDKQQLLYPLLQGDILSEATVIVTSRPGPFSANNYGYHEMNVSQRPDSSLMSFVELDCSTYFYSLFQKRILIKGVQEAQQKQFLHKHLSHAFTTEELDKLNRVLSNNYDRKLFECPLFLLLVAVLCIETNLIEVPRNRTDLYKHLFTFILQRGLSSLEDYHGTVDLFEYEEKEAPFYVLLLVSFGKLALNSVKERQLTFSEQEILRYFTVGDNRILNLGFMTYKNILFGVKENMWYEPVHRTLLEFAAAYYLYYMWKSGETEKFKVGVMSLEPFLPDHSGRVDSLVFTFLSGLMEKEPKLLFDSLVPFTYKYIYWWDSYYNPMLSEIEESEALLTALLPFITKEWHINSDRDVNFCYSTLHEKVIDRAVRTNQIQSIVWDVCSSASLPSQLKVPNIVLHISRKSNFLYRLQCQKLECDTLCCQLLGDEFSKMKRKNWAELTLLVNSITWRRVSFHFTATSSVKFLPILLEETKTGFLKRKVFQRIKCELKSNKNHLLKLLLSLITTANVEEIHLILRCSKTAGTFMSATPWKHKVHELSKRLWADFVHRIAEIEHVKVFILENYNQNSCVRIDECSLCNSGKKQWRAVKVEGYVDLKILGKNSQFHDIAQGEAGGTAFIRAVLQSEPNLR